MAPTTRYNISIELHSTNLLSFTFYLGAQGQGFPQPGLKFSILQFLHISYRAASQGQWLLKVIPRRAIGLFPYEVLKTLFTGMKMC